MNKENFIKCLISPQSTSDFHNKTLKVIVDEYPYFQSARMLYVKLLKDVRSFKYNNELKKTAAYISDRTILFDFITSDNFINEKKITEEKPKKDVLNSLKKIEDKKKNAEIKLEIGKPLPFKKNDQLNFHSWLKLSEKEILKSAKVWTKQDEIIEKFISTTPKISKIDKTKPLEVKVKKEQSYPQLMTETLAKIYLEQKKYDSAIKAYEILSLKYPEKSRFFADQIEQIRILQKPK